MNQTPDLFTRYRTTDPDTSVAAATRIAPHLSEIQEQVLATITKYNAYGLTDVELEQILNNHSSTLRTRRSELVDKGLIKDSGERRLIKGSRRIVWRVANV